MNPNGPNEDFQTSQVRKYAESIYNATEAKLIEVISERLSLKDKKDANWDPIVPTFEYAYWLLRDAGYLINHTFIEDGWTCTLKIDLFKKCDSFSFWVRTSHSTSITI